MSPANSIELNSGLSFFIFIFSPSNNITVLFPDQNVLQKTDHFYVETKYLVPFFFQLRYRNRQDNWLKVERLCSRFQVQTTGVWCASVLLCSAGSMPLVTQAARGSVNTPSKFGAQSTGPSCLELSGILIASVLGGVKDSAGMKLF